MKWSETAGIAWRTELPGGGWSSPICAGGAVFVTTAVEEGESLSLRAIALDVKSGAEIWEREIFSHRMSSVPTGHRKNSHASPTPIASDGRLYVHFGHLGTAALSAADGSILWKQTSLSYQPVHGNGGSPALVDGLLIFSADGGADPFIAALDADAGTVRWKVPRPTDAQKKFSFSTPAVIEVNGGTQVISSGSNLVQALDPQSGREIWRVRYEGYSVVPKPIFTHGLVCMSTGFDDPVILAIRPDGTGDVTDSHVAWKVTKRAPTTPSLVAVGNEIYMVSDGGILSCLDAATGEIHWDERVCGPISASPIAADGLIYLQDEQGTGVVIRADPAGPRPVAQNRLGEKTLASYAVGDGCFFIRTESSLVRVEDR